MKDFEAVSTYSMGELRKFSFEAVVVGPDQKIKIMVIQRSYKSSFDLTLYL